MNTFTLELRMYDEVFFPKFAFNANDEADALNKAIAWAHYQGFISTDVTIRQSSEYERENWLHNEYMRNGQLLYLISHPVSFCPGG